YIWQGQLYFAAGATKQAEAAFRKAAALRPDAIDGWLTLLRYLILSNRREEAVKLFDETKDKGNKIERTLFLAMAYALVGRTEEARPVFEQARPERPTDLRTVRAEAEFLFQTGLANKDKSKDAAIQAFERVLALQTASPADKDFARMMIGICLVTGRDSR